MDTSLLVSLLFIGIAAGILSGLVGIGGGIILVPALIYLLKYNQHQAQGTSLGVLVLPVVFLGFYQYYIYCKKSGTPINFSVIGLLAIGFVIGGYFGGRIAAKLDTQLMKRIFAIILIYTAIKMLGIDQWLFRWFRQLLGGSNSA